jgi:hypothetical protein
VFSYYACTKRTQTRELCPSASYYHEIIERTAVNFLLGMDIEVRKTNFIYVVPVQYNPHLYGDQKKMFIDFNKKERLIKQTHWTSLNIGLIKPDIFISNIFR